MVARKLVVSEARYLVEIMGSWVEDREVSFFDSPIHILGPCRSVEVLELVRL